ncbi:AbrB family transcriptional regulator [Corynebacterium pseudotuberculosis]|uniref:AbrB family transcriptional regulator n=1 Tax=Corynebacterium pseudotuberculosis (strain C231) TaxID=681645 RepID=D9QDK3_CORP2|nr:AbrB family transcriptional regulator [Corynebacterium pseudotuberculosis]ADK27873.1 AbrB family transcriptional regulator [Corynebacterium pseudotuberculosis FRC41]ADL09576.1 AbrB family transcriptional regulator [Corynebacterium pseudotuberculosis C231]ADL19986.1 AbrB family transcriptional regulator [Corynebacterium pseudotuberculosis 1002]ADO25374.1 AbrB family transcriptional regulator [Corynebacterium pseudotuberculosis I19]AEK91427.1 Ammonia monooxygenase [Corynebacterium pseudotuber
MRRFITDRDLALRWSVVAPISLALGFLFAFLHVPAAWILAAIATSGASALITGKELPMNRQLFNFARGFIGILAALPLLSTELFQLGRFVLPGIAVTIVTLMIGVSGGLLLTHKEPEISQETGVLSMLAGGASIMPLLAKDLGADYRYVALSQYLRLLTVSVSLPLITHLFPHSSTSTALPAAAQSQPWWALTIVIVIALVGHRVGKLLRLPAASILGPMVLLVVTGFFIPHEVSLAPPEPVRYFAFLSIGWICGGSLSLGALKAFASQLPSTILFVVVLIAGCALTAWPLMSVLHISYFEAYLATSPGALETVLALSSEGGAGSVVVATQVIRLISVIALAGWIPAFLQLLRRGKPKAS